MVSNSIFRALKASTPGPFTFILPATKEVPRRMLNPKDYLRHRLTGDHITDVSDASGTGLFNVRERAWSQPLLSLLDLSPSWLPTNRSGGQNES